MASRRSWPADPPPTPPSPPPPDASPAPVGGGGVGGAGAGAGAGADATAVEMMFVTFDGEDNCTEYKPTCGVDSRQFAAFLLDYLEVNTAMEMDQGGSTAMWVKGQPRDGIVSNPTVAERELFNGVFLGVPASSLQPKASQPRGG